MSERNAISVGHVSKSFKLPHEKHSGLKQAVLNFRPGKKYELQQVLKDISFDIKQGEFFGIVGRNGSGKSTLLKLLAQIYVPEKGVVKVNGSLTPFIELGVGFNPELTGRENVYLNGALLGFDRKQVAEMYDDIVEFAEIERFMDQKLKNYSSGMQVRLAFSIAIRANSDILLIDEVLAVGDAAFQQKCFRYFDRLKREKRTIVFVSHDMSSVKQFCDRAVLIDKGEVKLIGDTASVALAYERLNFDDSPEVAAAPADHKLQVATYNETGRPTTNFEYGEDITFKISWPEEAGVHIAGVVLSRGSEVVFATNSIGQGVSFSGTSAQLKLKANLGTGRYHVLAGIFGKTRFDNLGSIEGAEIMIYNQPTKGAHDEEWEGLTYVENTWR